MAGIVALVATLVVVIKEHWQQICDFFSMIGTWIYNNVIKPVADYNPIGGLWKHEVYELASYLKDKYEREKKNYRMSNDSFDSIDDLKMLEKYKNKIDAIDFAIGIRPTFWNYA